MEVASIANFRKAIGVGSMASVMLAGSILWCGGIGWSAPQIPGQVHSRDAAPGSLHPNDNVDMLSVEHQAAKGKLQPRLSQPLLTEKELIKLIKHDKKHLSKVNPALEARGIAFELTPGIEAELQKAGADENFIVGLKLYTPAARAKVSVDALRAESGPTQEEVRAYNQLKTENNPDKRIQQDDTFAMHSPRVRCCSKSTR
jgi:hypothetical protein